MRQKTQDNVEFYLFIKLYLKNTILILDNKVFAIDNTYQAKQ